MDDKQFLKPQQASHKIKYADAMLVSRPSHDHMTIVFIILNPHVLFVQFMGWGD